MVTATVATPFMLIFLAWSLRRLKKAQGNTKGEEEEKKSIVEKMNMNKLR